MYRSTNKLARPLRIALFGLSGAGRVQLSAALVEALKKASVDSQVETPDICHLPCGADMIFLMGLQSPHAEDTDADIALRQRLARHHLPYQVLYGTPGECLVQAMDVIRSGRDDSQRPDGSIATTPATQAASTRQWVWVCDKCSDPQCEHQLLTSLLASRSAMATGQLP